MAAAAAAPVETKATPYVGSGSSLIVTVYAGFNLINLDTVGKSDPYLKIQIQDAKAAKLYERKSPVVMNNLNPIWNFTTDFSTEIQHAATGAASLIDGLKLLIEVWDQDTATDEYMGHYAWELKSLDGLETKGTFALQPKTAPAAGRGKSLGTIEVKVQYRSGKAGTASGAAPAPAKAAAAAGAAAAPTGVSPIVRGGDGVVLGPAPGKWVIGKTNDINLFYTLGKQMGEPGQFGRAVQATHKRTSQLRACKIINKARFARASPGDQKYHYDSLRGEIDIMSKLSDPNVIQLFDVFETENDLYIVMELCAGGELFDRIKAQGSYSERDASKVLRQIFSGILYLHSRNIAHCDLKPDNFLFLNRATDAPLKIIDFGMSKFVKRREYFSVICGTPYYVAPEVIEGKYSEHCDMWSLGVIMFVMLFGYPPFYADQSKHGDMTDQIIFSMVKKGFSPETKDGYGAHFPRAIQCSASAKDLITHLLTLDTAKRYTAAEAMEHPWLKGTTATETPIVATVLTNLKNFNGANKFKAAVLNVMTDYVGPEEIKQLQAAFRAMDENKDGKISVAELKKAMNKPGGTEFKGINEQELLKLMTMADVDGDGCLSYQELFNTVLHRKLAAKEERLYEAFSKFDLNGDGRVSFDEISAALGDPVKAREIIAEVDADGDGNVSYDEFLAIWRSKEETAAGTTSAAAGATPATGSTAAAAGAAGTAGAAAAAAAPAKSAP